MVQLTSKNFFVIVPIFVYSIQLKRQKLCFWTQPRDIHMFTLTAIVSPILFYSAITTKPIAEVL